MRRVLAGSMRKAKRRQLSVYYTNVNAALPPVMCSCTVGFRTYDIRAALQYGVYVGAY